MWLICFSRIFFLSRNSREILCRSYLKKMWIYNESVCQSSSVKVA